jgi:hypothetical protein
MSLKKTVETLTHTAVTTAVSTARHPIGTAAKATGLVKDTAGFGIGLVRDRIGGASAPAAAPDTTIAEDVSERVETAVEEVKDAAVTVKEKVEEKAPAAVKKVEEKTPAAVKEATEAPAAEKPAEKQDVEPAEDPRDHIPGPDLAAFPPPAPEDLPEPVVIVAE